MGTRPDGNSPLWAGLDDTAALLRAMPDREALLRVLLGLLRRWTGCDAVGVRLARDEDFPYYAFAGFPEEFILAETSLCTRQPDGLLVRDAAGRPVLACMCGAVLAGHVDPGLPFFTPQGSFFTGSTSRLVAAGATVGLPSGTRNRCLAAGYETVLLTPLRAGDLTFGLLQINDRRRDCLNDNVVAAVERLADGVATLLLHQEMQEALAEAQALYKDIFYTNIAIKLLVDPQTGRIVEANPAACAFYGYCAEALHRLSIWDINVGRPEDVLAEMRAARDHGRRLFRFTHRLASGELREVEVYSGPVGLPGRTLLFSIIHDVTDRVRAEKARDRAEQILRHDLRSPLAGIAGLSRQLAEAGLCPMGQEMAEVIRDTAERLYSLVGRTLDLQKIEQGCYVLRPRPVALGPLLHHIAQEAASLIRTRQVCLQLADAKGDCCEDGPVVSGEADLLAILFSNLVTNALEAAPTGSVVHVHRGIQAGWAVISLHNQGVVPEDIRPRFFTKYATSGKENGTGLGAYTSLALAKLHHGDIDWESDAVTGTCLTVRLPLATQAQAVQSV